MRLICPKCSAQYEIDDSLVPTGGREVECSGCGHVWFQPGRMAGADQTPAQLSRPLNESILSVLREEAERELSARKAKQEHTPTPETRETEVAAPPTPQPQQVTALASEPQPSAPAPSAPVATPAAGGPTVVIRDNFSFDWKALRDSGPPARPATELPDVSALAATLVHESVRPNPVLPQLATKTAEAQTHTSPPPPVVRKTYRHGLVTGLLVVVLLAGLYATAPSLADKGTVGATLMEWRELADQGHGWVYARIRGQD